MSIKPLRKAVFPVGGLGTRFLPATKALPKDVLHEVWPDLTPSIEETRYVKVYADEGYHHIDVPDEVAPAQPYDWEFELDMALLALQAKQHLQAQGAQVPPY